LSKTFLPKNFTKIIAENFFAEKCLTKAFVAERFFPKNIFSDNFLLPFDKKIFLYHHKCCVSCFSDINGGFIIIENR